MDDNYHLGIENKYACVEEIVALKISTQVDQEYYSWSSHRGHCV